MAAGKNRAIFLDRDGVINKHIPYCSRPEDFEFLPLVAEGIRLLNEKGFKVVVVTNQSGIGRGYFTEGMLSVIHYKMTQELLKHGAHIDAIYYCPHHPEDNCTCRKPNTDMLLKAAKELNIELNQSYMIGDSEIDIETGKKVGCKTFLIVSDEKKDKSYHHILDTQYIVPNIFAAAQLIISNTI